MGQSETDPENPSRVAAFQQALVNFGWSDGRNIVVDWRWGAGNPDRMRNYSAELIGLVPDVVVAESTPAAAALHQQSPKTPVIFIQVANPVGSGFVASLAHPKGMMTGFTNFEPSMGGKWLELLKETAPRIKRAAAIFNPETPSRRASLDSHEAHSIGRRRIVSTDDAIRVTFTDEAIRLAEFGVPVSGISAPVPGAQ
jgi:putative ABC transport system substrate-binding protein